MKDLIRFGMGANQRLNVRMLGRALMVVASLLFFTAANAEGPTPEQLQKLKEMTPEQRATLSQAVLGGGGGQTQTQSRPIINPQIVKLREVGAGRLESEIKTPGKDERISESEVAQAPKVDVPVVEVSSQKSAEKVEVRRAFEAFARESKPMVVGTEGLKQFGYELFAGEPSSFAPVTDVPVPAEYVLGPGDEIKVQLFGKDSKEIVLTVDREGVVAFPNIGPIALAGLDFATAKATLADQIKQKMIGVSASITMGQLRSIRIFALGDVYRPGSYTVSGLATLSHALFASGGIKKIGSLRNIQLKRNGRRIATIDLYDFLMRGDTSNDVRLLPGDVVFVPTIGKTAAIAGEVVRPAIYELKNEQVVNDILKLAGGLLPNAFTDKAMIERFNPKGDKQVLNFGLAGVGLATKIQNGDVIKVFPATEFESNQILLIGNVKRPGKLAWHEGMRVMDVIQSRDDLLPESLMDYGIIEREAEDTREPVVVRFRLGDLLEKGGNADNTLNIKLEPRDRIYVFQRANFREQPKVSIAGSVQNSGQYEFKRNMRLADLVLAAGGILRDTDLGAVEIYRTDPVSKDISLLKVNLSRAMSSGSEDDLLLQDLDRVVIHSVFETKLRYTVTVAGEVHNPVTVPLMQGMRVADLLFAGGSVNEFAFLKKARLTRYVVENGEKRISSSIGVDLAAALQGEEKANFLLEPYDSLVVSRMNDESSEGDLVSVTGEVRKSATVPFVDGMRVSDLVFNGGGVTETAWLGKAEITRYTLQNGEKRVSRHIEINLEAALKGDEQFNLLLEPYDVLMVRRLSNFRAAEQVSIQGEVLHPGTYPVEEGEHLSDLLQRVGGFTKDAFLPAAIFVRESIREAQQKQLDELIQRMEGEVAQIEAPVAALRDETLRLHRQEGVDKSKKLLAQLKTVRATGRMVIELHDVAKLRGRFYDIRLRAGDKLFVPKRPDEVLVLGEVYNLAALLFNPRMNRDEYVRQAGPTRMADTDAIYIVRANGVVEASNDGGWFSSSGNIGPGDTVVVPQQLDHVNYLDIALDWSRAMMQIGTSVAAMKAIGVFR